MSTKTVRLDSELMDKLAKERNGFETPNECLKRLLNSKSRSCAEAKPKEETEKVEEDEIS